MGGEGKKETRNDAQVYFMKLLQSKVWDVEEASGVGGEIMTVVLDGQDLFNNSKNKVSHTL